MFPVESKEYSIASRQCLIVEPGACHAIHCRSQNREIPPEFLQHFLSIPHGTPQSGLSRHRGTQNGHFFGGGQISAFGAVGSEGNGHFEG